MAEAGAAPPASPKPAPAKKPKWRAWLRAIHRDVGYLAVGSTLIYTLSGIAMNHVDDRDPSFRGSDRTLAITPVPDDATDDEAAQRGAGAVGLGAPSTVYRAGDEVRLEYENGSKVTAIAC